MFQQIRFPSEALDDIRALVKLDVEQLVTFSQLLDSKEAAPPIEDAFEEKVAERIGLSLGLSESVVRLGIVLQSLDLSASTAVKAVDDIAQLVNASTGSGLFDERLHLRGQASLMRD